MSCVEWGRVWGWLLGLILAGSLTGCGGPFLAVDPGPGDLRGQWLVNGSASAVLSEDVPLVAHLRVRNEIGQKVRMVGMVQPLLEGYPELKWRAYRKLPSTLEAGEEWEGVWRLLEMPGEGAYVVMMEGESVLEASAAEVEIRGERLPAPLRAEHHCVAARLTGEVDQVVEMLSAEIEAGLAPPSTHLQLAELLESVGEGERALRQYELFAERVYADDEPPGWLRSRMSLPEQTVPEDE